MSLVGISVSFAIFSYIFLKIIHQMLGVLTVMTTVKLQ